ncbi:UPF0149 family protein [Ideonella livida]|uniref:UPF0149 family protein n=1 Tax=Ideonella livida TaxID=2707176 RepID=A0A7C9TM07_9BURK|nr:UPF0149 family protein [Ideonella livida]NDY92623.1 UPF0149 family protein [Ideonella livida]
MECPDYQPDLATSALDEVALDELDTLLQGLEATGGMPSLDALDGYVTGLLTGPRLGCSLPGRDWMPAVWGGADQEARAFASQKRRKRLITQVLRYMRQVDADLAGGALHWEPVFSMAEDGDGREWVDARDWCAGFLSAVDLDPAAWQAWCAEQAIGAELWAPVRQLAGDGELASPEEPEAVDALSRAVPALVDALAGLSADEAGGEAEA